MVAFARATINHVANFLVYFAWFIVAAQAEEHFNITAIGAANGRSTIECWQIARPFDISTDPGTAGTAAQQLGDSTNLTFTILPPRFDGGLHHAPAVQYVTHDYLVSARLSCLLTHLRYVAFTSGVAVVSLPDSNETATVIGGKYGLIVAADIASVSKQGHITRYPSNSTTTALQIRMKDNTPPKYSILHSGACQQEELNGI